MGILDDAIREHLDLKRKHGARDAELREIEDEALGSGEQPDSFAAGELFTEVAPAGTAEAERPGSSPERIGELSEPDVGGEEPTRLVEPEALRPSTPPPEPSGPESPSEPLSPPEGIEQIPGQTELPSEEPASGRSGERESYQPPSETFEPPAETTEPPSPSESLEDLIAEEEPFPEDAAAPAGEATDEAELPLDPEAPAPVSEPEAIEPEALEKAPEPPRSTPEPPPPPPDAGPEPPGRARGRVDVPTQEHPPPGQTGGLPAVPEPGSESRPEPEPEPVAEEEPVGDEPAAESGGPQLYDFETDEEPVPAPQAEPEDDFEALGPAEEEEAPYLEEEEPYAEEPAPEPEAPYEEPGTAVRPPHEDEEAYEGTATDPEETYEQEGEEGLWFEKGPPKDFDFDE